MKKIQPIAFLDSGIGGTTILKDVIELLPNENYIYYPDSKNLPYGNKSKEDLFQIVDKVVQKLIKFNPKIIVCACNTATAMVLNEIRSKYKNIIFVGTEPAIKVVHDNYKDKKTIILTTKGTGHSEKFKELFRQHGTPQCTLVEAPLLAELIEKEEDLYPYLNDLLCVYEDVKVVVLGCTHFPLAKETISKILGPVAFIHGGPGIANRIKDLLLENNLPCNQNEFDLKIITQDTKIKDRIISILN